MNFWENMWMNMHPKTKISMVIYVGCRQMNPLKEVSNLPTQESCFDLNLD